MSSDKIMLRGVLHDRKARLRQLEHQLKRLAPSDRQQLHEKILALRLDIDTLQGALSR